VKFLFFESIYLNFEVLLFSWLDALHGLTGKYPVRSKHGVGMKGWMGNIYCEITAFSRLS